MTFIKRYQVKNRSELLAKATRIAKSDEKDMKRLTTVIKVALLPIYVISKTTQWMFKTPMYICIGIGAIMEYMDELTEDIYHLVEDRVFLFLHRVMKIDESEGPK